MASTRTRNLLVGLAYLALLAGALWLAQTTLNNYYLRILAVIGINIMLTVSLNLTNGFTGDFSLGIAAFMGIGAYTAALLSLPAAAKVAGFPALPGWLQELTLQLWWQRWPAACWRPGWRRSWAFPCCACGAITCRWRPWG
jgi:ABC-type branched-subunit amino acid transport system permease subunit